MNEKVLTKQLVTLSPELSDKAHSLICEVVGAWNKGSIVTYEVRSAVRRWLMDVADAEQERLPEINRQASISSNLVTRLRAERHISRHTGNGGMAHETVSAPSLDVEAADEIERLHAALERYGRHAHPNCHDLKAVGSAERNGCLCGLDAVLSGNSSAPKRHSRDCDCHDCRYAKKHPQIPHHALCGCWSCTGPAVETQTQPMQLFDVIQREIGTLPAERVIAAICAAGLRVEAAASETSDGSLKDCACGPYACMGPNRARLQGIRCCAPETAASDARETLATMRYEIEQFATAAQLTAPQRFRLREIARTTVSGGALRRQLPEETKPESHYCIDCNEAHDPRTCGAVKPVETFRQGIDRVRAELNAERAAMGPTPEQTRAYAQAHDDPALYNSTVKALPKPTGLECGDCGSHSIIEVEIEQSENGKGDGT